MLVLATEIFCVSPATYRVLRNSKTKLPPKEENTHGLMNKASSDKNHNQPLVNLLFDQVKLKQALTNSGGHLTGLSDNNSEELATSD